MGKGPCKKYTPCVKTYPDFMVKRLTIKHLTYRTLFLGGLEGA